jgi:lipopolysaccharide transport system ATP-binding protein
MSSDAPPPQRAALKLAGVSKCFQIYATPRDRLKQFVLPRVERLLGAAPSRHYREFWALKDVSFEIARGETVGIVGRNGSGKSTLLQIICGTLSATAGTVETNGRIAALLELGSGFNPEFSGRDNVFMNASLLGLEHHETAARFDQIAAFADIGDFIEQPVKTYSSGMYVRLAFSVAMHVDPEILIVDEALSVGDAFFQAKCAHAMRELMDRGTTILFVSHDVTSVKALCQRAILLEAGEVRCIGDVNTVIEQYYSTLVAAKQGPSNDLPAPPVGPADAPIAAEVGDRDAFASMADFQRIRGDYAEFLNVCLLDSRGRQVDAVDLGERVTLRQVLRIKQAVPRLALAYHLRDRNGFDLVYADTGLAGDRHLESPVPGETYVIDWTFDMQLRDGQYVVASMASLPHNAAAGDVTVADFVPISCKFTVSRGASLPVYGAVHWPNDLEMRQLAADS